MSKTKGKEKTLLQQPLWESIQLVEAVEGESLPEGVLARVRGPFARIGVKNKNGRVYEEAVWDKVLNDSLIMTAIKERKLLGEAEHPDEPQTKIDRVSHVVTSLKKVGDMVMGEADVLDTPRGKIVATLLKANIPVGVSSRALGDLENVGEYQRVIPEAYDFKTFDFTLEPSVEEARPELVGAKRDELEKSFESILKSPKVDYVLVEHVAKDLKLNKLAEDAHKLGEKCLCEKPAKDGKGGCSTCHKPIKEEGEGQVDIGAALPASKQDSPEVPAKPEEKLPVDVVPFVKEFVDLFKLAFITDDKPISKELIPKAMKLWIDARGKEKFGEETDTGKILADAQKDLENDKTIKWETELAVPAATVESKKLDSIQEALKGIGVQKEVLETISKENISLKDTIIERDKQIATLTNAEQSLRESTNKEIADLKAKVNVLEQSSVEKDKQIATLESKAKTTDFSSYINEKLNEIRNIYPYVGRAKKMLEACKTKEAIDLVIGVIKDASVQQYQPGEIEKLVEALQRDDAGKFVDGKPAMDEETQQTQASVKEIAGRLL